MFKLVELNKEINENGRFLKIENHTNSGITVYKKGKMVDFIRPLTFKILKNDKYVLKDELFFKENMVTKEKMSIRTYNDKTFVNDVLVETVESDGTVANDSELIEQLEKARSDLKAMEENQEKLIQEAIINEKLVSEANYQNLEAEFKKSQEETRLVKTELATKKGELAEIESQIVTTQSEIEAKEVEIAATTDQTVIDEANRVISEKNNMIEILTNEKSLYEEVILQKTVEVEELTNQLNSVSMLLKEAELKISTKKPKITKFAKLLGYSETRVAGTLGTLSRQANMFSNEFSICKKATVEVWVQTKSEELNLTHLKENITASTVEVIRNRNNELIKIESIEIDELQMTESFLEKGYKGYDMGENRTVGTKNKAFLIRVNLEFPINVTVGDATATSSGTFDFKITNPNLTEQYQSCLIKLFQY